jgi:hypothetical protein
MKKFFVWALMATLMVAGSAFAAVPVSNATFATGAPTTTNNDDSCDISVAPAATLLLPYFEVDINSPATTAQTTLFTVTNVSRLPQIAHVTVWTDYSYPVLDFNIFLTGYDVQAINLYDVLVRGLVAPDNGTSNQTTPGSRSASNLTGNPNFLPGAAVACNLVGQNRGRVPEVLRQNVVSALTEGVFPLLCGDEIIGGTHNNAVGYITIDVAATCSTNLPTEPAYFTTEILFDNVLIGDYQAVNPNTATGNYAQGNPLVHIRAIPEGGPAGSVVATNLPYTFYSRYQSILTPTRDRRQPLPHVFAARYIEGGAGGFVTAFKIWREGLTGAGAECDEYAALNARMAVAELVRFDERENPFVSTAAGGFSPVPPGGVALPETSRTLTSDDIFPDLTSGDVAGWMYLNLHNNAVGADRPSQNWVIVSMFAEGRYSVDFDAAWLGNGCSALTPAPATIGPAPNVTPGFTP